MERVIELQNLITKARNDYYNFEPTVTDQLFDTWVEELTKLDPTNNAVIDVGAKVTSEWGKCKHKITMGSLDKVNSSDDLRKWYKSEDLFVTEKLDGISINCEYESGVLVRAITRGDGFTGEDILANVKNMIGVNKNISGFDGSLRGEIVITKSLFNKYFKDKSNTRNAASGVSKRLDGKGTEHLTVMFYGVYGNIDFKTEEASFDWMNKQSLITPNHFTIKFLKNKDIITEATELWDKYQRDIRDTLDYDIDGLVVRYDNFSYQKSFGELNGRPKGARAFKFDNIFLETKLLDVIWQVGNSGRVTPVGIVAPTILLGAEVRRATLHNISYIKSLNLTLNSKVLITRANEVIPYIGQLVSSGDKEINIPIVCPECSSTLEMVGENLSCLNVATCPAQIIGRIRNWINGLGILEWGYKLLTKLVEDGLVNDISDLYKLTINDLNNLERMGEKSSTNCFNILHNNKELPLDIFLGSLSIPMNSRSTIKLLINNGYNTLDDFIKATVDDFNNVIGMGNIKSTYLVNGLAENLKLINKLFDYGITIKEVSVGILNGGSFCFSGSFSMKKSVLEKMVSDNGGTVKKGVTKDLDYLVLTDPNSTSIKAKSAKKIGIKIISEDEFLKKL